jgi:hypothetical protein
VRAGPLEAEIDLVYNPTDESYDGSFPGEHAFVHVSATWPAGSADIVVALPAPVIIGPDPPIAGADLTVQWQPWRTDRDGRVSVFAGKLNSTLNFTDVETDPAVVTSLVVPSMFFPDNGSYYTDVAFDGTMDPTGGVSTFSPTFLFVLYMQHFDRMIL